MDTGSQFSGNSDSSVVNKFQQKYWKTKQTLIKVTGKKEDEHVVASDADLDAKLEVFHSVQRTCMELLKVIEQYQQRICCLSLEENELGRFLRSQGSKDKSRAGKVMQATGKALCFSSQQRQALRTPLCRLYQEVETFRYRAISDTWLTVNRMEQSRTEYRGALLWMKDVSQELDPDTHKQMEKFRKTTLLHFWEKISHTMAAIHESFKGYQPYNFTALKNLQGPLSKRLDQEARKKGKKKVKEKQEDEEKASDTAQLVSLGDDKRNQDTLQSAGPSHAGDCEQEGMGMGQMLSTGVTEVLPDGGRDDMALLNEILSGSCLEEGEFSWQWREVFGDSDVPSCGDTNSPGAEESAAGFLPSQLLDNNRNNLQSSDWTMNIPGVPTDASSSANLSSIRATGNANTESSRDLYTWFNLFADLDPLANPDAVGKTDKEHELLNA